MSSNERNDREQILLDIAVGERDAADPIVLDWCARDADFQRDLDEIVHMIASVSGTAQLEREVLADVACWEGGAAPGEERVEATLLALAEEVRDTETAPRPANARRKGPRHLAMALLGAAAALLVYVLVPSGADNATTSTQPDLILGRDGIVLVAPIGNVEDLTLFRWDYELPPGSSFELILRDPQTGQQIYLVERLNENQWHAPTPTPDNWPGEIEWEVNLVNSIGEVEVVSERARVSVARPE